MQDSIPPAYRAPSCKLQALAAIPDECSNWRNRTPGHRAEILARSRCESQTEERSLRETASMDSTTMKSTHTVSQGIPQVSSECGLSFILHNIPRRDAMFYDLSL